MCIYIYTYIYIYIYVYIVYATDKQVVYFSSTSYELERFGFESERCEGARGQDFSVWGVMACKPGSGLEKASISVWRPEYLTMGFGDKSW